jgi:hypothetical protein
MTSLQPRPVRLDGFRSHGEDWESLTFPRSADPPAPGGVGINSAGATAADVGGDVGSFPLHGTAWHAALGIDPFDEGTVESLEHLAAKLEEDGPHAEGGMLLTTLVRLRQGLAQVGLDAHAATPVQISAADALLLARLLLRRIG